VEAVFALVGVVLGAGVAGLVDYFVQRRRREEDDKREQEALVRTGRAAALVAAMELAEAEVTLESHEGGGEAHRPAARRNSVWTQRRELLAQQLGPVHAFPVAFVFSLVDRVELSGRATGREAETARVLFDFARVDILLAYATGKELPAPELVDAALYAAGCPPVSKMLGDPAASGQS
jgi:hypothetical protein